MELYYPAQKAEAQAVRLFKLFCGGSLGSAWYPPCRMLHFVFLCELASEALYKLERKLKYSQAHSEANVALRNSLWN